nr:beta-lactamase family protein [Acidicapsa acidisoli]
MQLVERGEFNLDLPIAQQLPQPLDSYEPYRDKASLLMQDPTWLSVTPRMCFNHTSGLANFADIEPTGQEDASALQAWHAIPLFR